jgi:hypothetical protein
MWEGERNTCMVLVGKPEGKRPRTYRDRWWPAVNMAISLQVS